MTAPRAEPPEIPPDAPGAERRKRLFEHLSPVELAVLALCMTLFSGAGTMVTDRIDNTWRDRYTGTQGKAVEGRLASLEKTIKDLTSEIHQELANNRATLDRLQQIKRVVEKLRDDTEIRLQIHETWFRSHERALDPHP